MNAFFFAVASLLAAAAAASLDGVIGPQRLRGKAASKLERQRAAKLLLASSDSRDPWLLDDRGVDAQQRRVLMQTSSPPPYPPPAYPPPYPPPKATPPSPAALPPYPPSQLAPPPAPQPPIPPLPPFPPQPPASPLPTSDLTPPETSTPRTAGSTIVQISENASLTTSYAACVNIGTYPDAFNYQFVNATVTAWNAANSNLTIQMGDAFVLPNGTISLCSAPSSGRRLLQSSTVSVQATLNMPPGTTVARAAAGTAGFYKAALQQYSSGQFASNYGVTSASLQVGYPTSSVYSNPPPPSPPSPPPGSGGGGGGGGGGGTNNVALGVGIGVGVGGTLIIAGIGSFIYFKRRRSTVEPS